MHRLTLVAPILVLWLTACEAQQSAEPGADAPNTAGATQAEVPAHELSGTFAYMADNALLADMTVTDMHFLPHRARLSVTGEQRVRRLAELMGAYGGTIRLNSDETDGALIEQRAKAVVTMLTELGVDTTTEVLRPDLAGGRGRGAVEAILIKKHEGTYKPKKSDDQAAAAAGAP
ncbi:MAG: hypothetical protein CHACPFDD_03681 [Phycisphaerae bacterium]|nr:hypothetical protein [Phycisphaerae bacterium]